MKQIPIPLLLPPFPIFFFPTLSSFLSSSIFPPLPLSPPPSPPPPPHPHTIDAALSRSGPALLGGSASPSCSSAQSLSQLLPVPRLLPRRLLPSSSSASHVLLLSSTFSNEAVLALLHCNVLLLLLEVGKICPS
ncbi:hypothetical protein Tsubulata_038529 [Turnera subulata]|uniref:Uncharacterized protein n=1 Tax=Turnera subulata TaxID=218843 RepID=A0A9Q0FLL3_9ROSI|nr:hypothetical protein Tsubulata_038529 [Turnera subulata]